MDASADAGAEPSSGEAVERREAEQVEHEAARLRRGDSRSEGSIRLEPGDPHGEGAQVGVQRRGPVVEDAPALADAGIVGEEALDIMLDRPLAAEDRGRDLEVVAAIAGDERQVAAADPDDRADRVADAEDRQPGPSRVGQPGLTAAGRAPASPSRSPGASGPG